VLSRPEIIEPFLERPVREEIPGDPGDFAQTSALAVGGALAMFSRTFFYVVLFGLFGVIAMAAGYTQKQAINSEWLVMLSCGIFGLLTGGHDKTVRKAYDLCVGLLFLLFGGAGLFHRLHLDFTYHGTSALDGFFQIAARIAQSQSLALVLLHILLGFMACSVAMKRHIPTPLVTVQTNDGHERNT
jgi:hypothetical protein